MNQQTLGQRAYAHARWLLENIGARGSATREEQMAAEYVRSQLTNIGLAPRVEPFCSPTSAWRPFAVTTSLSLLGKLLYGKGGKWGKVAGISAGALASYWAIREIDLDDTLLSRVLPNGPSRNVWARIPAASGTSRKQLVILGHLDSHRSPWIFQTEERVRWFNRTVTAGFAGLAISLLLMLIHSVSSRLPKWFLAIPAITELMTLGLCIDADRSPYSPGANDNASAVGSVLALAAHLKDHPLPETDVIVLFTGCEEVGCYGMRTFLREHEAELRRLPTFFIDFEMTGVGDLAYVVDEGLLIRHTYSPQLRQIAEEVSREEPDLRARPQHAGAYGESVVIHKAGYHTITINSLLPGNRAAYWHQMADTIDKLEPTALDRACRFVLEIAQRL
jgi:hypothetical protein